MAFTHRPRDQRHVEQEGVQLVSIACGLAGAMGIVTQ